MHKYCEIKHERDKWQSLHEYLKFLVLIGVVGAILQMTEDQTSKVCLVSFGTNKRKISWKTNVNELSVPDYDNINREFKKVFADLVPLEENIVFQKWDQDFEDWVDINPHQSVENMSKLKAFCQQQQQGGELGNKKPAEHELERGDVMKKTGHETSHLSAQRTIGKDGKLGPRVSIQSEEEERTKNVVKVGVNVDDLKADSKLFGQKSKNDDDLTTWQKKMNESALLLCMENPSLTLKRGELLEKAREKVDNDSFVYKKGKSRSKKYGAASMEENKAKRPKLEANERRTLIEETKFSINEQNEKLAMLEREKCKLVNMKQFGSASVILDRISSARKEKGQLSKKLGALEQKEAKSIKRKLALTEREKDTGQKGNKKMPGCENKGNLMDKYLKPQTAVDNNVQEEIQVVEENNQSVREKNPVSEVGKDNETNESDEKDPFF
jgi:hypothetical protein